MTHSTTPVNFLFEAEAHDSAVFDPAAIGIDAIGEIESGPQVFLDNYPHTAVLFIQPLEGSLDIRLSDGHDIHLGCMEFSVIFPQRLITISTKAKKNHFAYLSLKGPRAVETVLKLGFWEFESATDDFPTAYFRQVCKIFQRSGCKSDDPESLLTVERMMRTMAARRLHCGGNIPFFRAVKVINNMDLTNFTTEAAARAIGISRSSLRNLFLDANFMPPGAYMDSVRAARAKEYLYSSQMSTEQIAHALGFANENSFAVFFRRVVGTTPAKYRRQPIMPTADKRPKPTRKRQARK